jgi:hypothetical protein
MSEYDPENPPVDDDEPVESPTPIRRVGRGDRKRRLKQNRRGDRTNPFDELDDSELDDSELDDSELVEFAHELPNPPGRPLPDDIDIGSQTTGSQTLEGDYVIDNDDRFPPVVVARPQTRTERRSRRSGSDRSEIDRSQPMARKRRVSRQDRIALLFFLATLAVIAYFVYIWQNPYSVLNPLAPERPVIYVTATPGAGIPGAVDIPNAGATFAYASSGEIETSPANDQCDRVILTGLIQGSTSEQNFAVRVTGGSDESGVDEGVVTNYFEEARAQVYLITVPMPQAQTTYMVQLYDLAGQALSASVPLSVAPGCTGNRISVNFAPLPS